MAERHRLLKTLVPSLALVLFASLATPALAQAAVPVWRIVAQADSTVEPGGQFNYRVEVLDVGDAPAEAEAEAVHFNASLPSGLKATSVTALGPQGTEWDCSATVFPSASVACGDLTDVFARTTGGFSILNVHVSAGASLRSGSVKTASFEVAGGGAASSTTVDPISIAVGPPPFGLAALDGATTAGASGAPSTGAATHPFASSVSFDLNTVSDPRPFYGDLSPVEPLKDVVVELPPGLVGAPAPLAQCRTDQLSGSNHGPVACPSSSQVGTATVRLNGSEVTRDSEGEYPVFNMVPPPGVPARFGFNVIGTITVLDAVVRSKDDYAIAIVDRNASEGLPIAGTTVALWGDPASEEHRSERSCAGHAAPDFGGPDCPAEAEGDPSKEAAFLRDPTSCGGPEALRTTMHVDSWANPGALTADGEPDLSDPAWKSASTLQHQPPGYPHPPSEWGPAVAMEGCASVPFEPTITLRPTTNKADSPTGLSFDLTMPQQCWEAGQAASRCQADVKDAFVSQPLGMRVNPATADGLTGCSEQQIGFIGGGFPMPNPTHFNGAEPTCPDSSKIGTVEIESPLIPDKLEGGIYQAKQGENPFGATLAFYAVANADGVMIKLPAEVVTDPQTGQVTTIFRDSPQLPFDHYRLHFFGGSRAPLITPPTCGTYTTHASFTGWANPAEAAHPEDSFQITEGPNGTACPNGEGGRPFNPSFEAGTENPLAGAFSPFVLKVGREDGSQELSGLETTLPEGLIGRLAGIPYCSDAALAAAEHTGAAAERANPSCPAASKVGIADAAAGAGPTPFHNPGTAYLAGPYKGAPLSLAIVTPALAGPLDLGTVVVRAALRVDPTTTQITAVSDRLPLRILSGGDGFPLDLRQITVQMNRPGFTLNPTSCDPMAVDGQITALQGATANVSSRFQVGGCDRLAFKPKLSLRLKGKTNRGAHPALSAVLTMPPSNQANIARAQVTLPHAEFLDQGHIQNVCTRVQFAAGGCPSSSVLGYAKAYSPLLEQPLQGPVYLMSGFGHKLPDLAADLNGQIRVLLHGKVDTGPGGGIRNTFEVVPDAPVTKFTLSLMGGSRGLIVNSENVCTHPEYAVALFDAQNGKVHDTTPAVQNSCKAKGHKKKHRGKK